MRNRPITIRDLALKLDVSISTVSRALRGAPEINPETKTAVLSLAKELNYQPNVVAQSLRNKKTNTIGVVVPEIEMSFFSSVMSGIQEMARSHGYRVLFTQSNECYQEESHNLDTLLQSRVDGILMSISRETSNTEHIQKILRTKTPIVFFDRTPHGVPASKVIVDDRDGAYKAVSYLISTGAKRIAHIGGPRNLEIARNRRKGYIDALSEFNHPVGEHLIVHCEHLKEDAVEATKILLGQEEIPDAIFCINDPVAIKVIQTIKDKGFRIPEDIQVIGFANDPVSEVIEPPLSTISQPSKAMGRAALKLLLDQLTDENDFQPKTQLMETELLLRGSTL